MASTVPVPSHGDADDDLEWEEWNPNKITFVGHMFAGSLAGLAEHVSLYPVDTIKTHVQCQRCGSITPMQTWASTVQIVHREGIFRLWRGVTAMFAGCIPAHAAYFSIFEASKRLTGADQQGHHPIAAAFCGAIAALSHDMFLTPFDVVKQRMQLGYYRDVRHCMKEMLRTEGLRAFYVSLPTTLMMNIPNGCIVVPVNESMKKILNPSGEYNVSASLLSGSIAGAVAAAITTPLDVVKTRLQTQNMLPCGEQAPDQCIKKRIGDVKSSQEVIIPKIVNQSKASEKEFFGSSIKAMQDIARKLHAEEGVAGFYRGVFPRMVTQAPAVAISWTVYEGLKSALGFDQGTSSGHAST